MELTGLWTSSEADTMSIADSARIPQQRPLDPANTRGRQESAFANGDDGPADFHPCGVNPALRLRTAAR